MAELEFWQREGEIRRREWRRFQRRLLAASAVAWAALMLEAAPFESIADFWGQALGQSIFALAAGLILLAGAAFLNDMYFWLRHGVAPLYFD